MGVQFCFETFPSHFKYGLLIGFLRLEAGGKIYFCSDLLCLGGRVGFSVPTAGGRTDLVLFVHGSGGPEHGVGDYIIISA